MKKWFGGILLSAAWSASATTAFGAGVICVTTNGTGTGTSWANASSLTNALAIAQTGDQLWIAQGTYGGSTLTVSTNNLTLYGGFTNGMTSLDERNWTNYPAILNGQAARQVMSVTSTNSTLDGLTIANGKLAANGAGVYKNTAGTLTLANCTIVSNMLTSSDLNGVGCYFSGCAVAISNCTFADNVGNSGRDFGVGFYALNANVSLTGCLFTNNCSKSFSGMGGAFYSSGGTLSASNCVFVKNQAMPGEGATVFGGGGGYLGGACSAEFRNCLFRANSGAYGGVFFIDVTAGKTVSAVNCVFAENAALNNVVTAYGGMGGFVYATSGNLSFTNCTIVTNTATRNGGAFFLTAANAAIGNSILWGNKAAAGDEIYKGAGTVSVAYSCLSGVGADDLFGTVSLNRITTNAPHFAVPYTDLHLKSMAGRWDPAAGIWTNDAVHSPCIDAGNPASPYALEPANNGGQLNLGVYGNTPEASKSQTAAAPTVENRGAVVTRTSAALSGELVSGTPSAITIYYGTNAANLQTQSSVEVYPLQQTGSVFSVSAHALLPSQLYYYACFATNGAGSDWAEAASFTTGAEGQGGGASIIHVDKDAAGAQNGRNWFDAYRTVAAGAAAANSSTNEIWVADGTYTEGELMLATNLSLYGWFAGWETSRTDRASSNAVVLDGVGLSRVINITGTNVILNGLTIANGNSGGNGSGLYKANAGTLSLANCTITNNGSRGDDKFGIGAYFKSCTVSISNCAFRNQNTAVQRPTGVGFYAESAAITLADSVFTGNRDTSFGGRGGALAVLNSSLSASRCVFTENGTIGREGAATQGGGGAGYIEGACSPVFRNCEFRGNFGRSGTTRYPAPGGALWAALTGANTAIVENCIFALNTNALYGGAIYVSSGDLIARNCTVVSNTAPTANGGAIYLGSTVGATIENSILWANDATTADEIYKGAGTVAVNYSCLSGVGDEDLFGVLTLNQATTNDPLFAVPYTDLHLKSTAGRWNPATASWTNDAVHSPSIDAGNPLSAYALEPEDNGDRVNQGAYGNTPEASKTPSGILPVVTNRGAAVTHTSVALSGELLAGTPSEITIYYGTSPVNLQNQSALKLSQLQQTGTVFSASAHTLLPSQPYYYACFASNAAGTAWADTGSFTTGTEGPGGGAAIIHVDKYAAGAQNGRNWHDAYRTIANGAAAANAATNEIWVADGVYAAGGLTLATNLSLYGWFAGWETTRTDRSSSNVVVLDGAGLTRVVDITGTNVTLDGLTIANGNLGGMGANGAGIQKGNAGALALVNCTIRDNVLSGDTQFGGGGSFSNCSVTMSNCAVIGNRGTSARPSGLAFSALNATIVLRGCTFTNNTSIGNAFGGAGGAFCQIGGTLTASDCVFAENRIPFKEYQIFGGGAGYMAGACSATFKNCTFRNNATSAGAYGDTPGGAFFVDTSGSKTVQVENCTIAGNSAAGPGGALYAASGVLDLKNSILWTNTALNGYEIFVTNAACTATVAYADLTGTNTPYVVAAGGAAVTWGAGILAADPLFAGTTDVHLKSRAGRWNPATGSWTTDTVSSPCIDAGAPASAYANEPVPNGKRINMGAYGNTAEASKSRPAGGVVVIVW